MSTSETFILPSGEWNPVTTLVCLTKSWELLFINRRLLKTPTSLEINGLSSHIPLRRPSWREEGKTISAAICSGLHLPCLLMLPFSEWCQIYFWPVSPAHTSHCFPAFSSHRLMVWFLYPTTLSCSWPILNKGRLEVLNFLFLRSLKN